MNTLQRCAAAAALCLGAAAHGQLTANPASVTFRSLADTAAIRLTDGGTPLPASSVHGTRVMINDSNYSHQFRIETARTGEAVVTLAPDPVYCEKGSFTLEVATSRGTARVEVLTPLDAMATSIENRAAALGVTPGELERRLTLPNQPLPAHYRMSLPASAPLGYTLVLPGPADAATVRTWSVNGTATPSESDGGLRAVMTVPGPATIAFTDVKDGAATASWRGSLRVEAEAPVQASASVRQPVVLHGPEGYNEYVWMRDGAIVSTAQQVTATYAAPGTFEIHLTASGPTSAEMLSFRSLTYVITVK